MLPHCKMHCERFSFKPDKGIRNTAQISLANIHIGGETFEPSDEKNLVKLDVRL